MSSYSYIWRFWGNRIIKNNNVCIRISIKLTSSTNYANGKQLEQSQDDRKWKIPLFSVLRHVKQMFSFWGFWNFCFQFVSFGYFCFWGSVDIQHFTTRKQILKKKIMSRYNHRIFPVLLFQNCYLLSVPQKNHFWKLSTVNCNACDWHWFCSYDVGNVRFFFHSQC